MLFQLFFKLDTSNWKMIILQLRLPRLLFEIGIGYALGFSALLFAATLRQPYLDGSMLGIASGAELMIALVTVVIPQALTYRVVIGAFTGVCCLLILRSTIFKLRNHSLFLIIGGFCLAMFFNAFTEILTESSGWTGKSLANVTWFDVGWLLIISLITIYIWENNRSYLKYFALSELQTRQLEINESKISFKFQVIAAALLGATTVVLGTVFFAGVVINQLVREFTQLGQLKRLGLVILFSILDVLFADTLAHFVFYPVELPTNAVLFVLLAPAFIFLIMRWSREI